MKPKIPDGNPSSYVENTSKKIFKFDSVFIEWEICKEKFAKIDS